MHCIHADAPALYAVMYVIFARRTSKVCLRSNTGGPQFIVVSMHALCVGQLVVSVVLQVITPGYASSFSRRLGQMQKLQATITKHVLSFPLWCICSWWSGYSF